MLSSQQNLELGHLIVVDVAVFLEFSPLFLERNRMRDEKRSRVRLQAERRRTFKEV